MELMSKGTMYGTPEVFKVAAGDYNALLRAEIILQVLMEKGVHNWDGFDDAMAAAEKELK